MDSKAIVSDKNTSYFNFEIYVGAFIAEKSTKQTTIVLLKWVQIAISCKKNFLGVYHKINGEQLQKYLDEFVYKLNR